MPPRPASGTGSIRSTRTSPIYAILLILPIYAVIAYFTLQTHYTLPTPLSSPVDAHGRAQISEAAILGYAKYLSEEIGYRTVGTVEHARGDQWMVEKAEVFRKECEEVVKKSTRKLECEVWHQRGSGYHRFDMMSRRLYKTYSDLTNIIVRISNGTKEGKEHAVLLNSHLDSTLPSPGAADDALAVGVMLECMRVLLADPSWEPSKAVIFLFNDAEESLQDGSHLFSTQHPIASTVRAAINLEAAGTTGPELLFQATSEEMIQAYSKVPYPFGTVVAADTFKTGVMLSDTDFRQFVQYLNVSGLDMAVVGNSYLYHMRKDLVENIEPGVAQHMAENTLSLIYTLTAPSSPLDKMQHGYTEPRSVYFSYLGRFVQYGAAKATGAYVVLSSLSLLAAARLPDPAPALQGARSTRVVKSLIKGSILSIGSLVGSVLGANALAGLMRAIGRPMSWFARPWLPMPLYAPPALAGFLIARVILPEVEERAVWAATASMLLLVGTGVHFAGLGSGAMLILSGAPLLVSLLPSSSPRPKLWTYFFAGIGALVTGVQVAASTLDVFVPLTGRIGADAPAEHVVASLVAILGAYTMPLLPGLAARYGRRSAVRGAMLCLLVTAAVAGIYAAKEPFDALHQRRLFVLHMHNTTSNTEHLHMAAVDGAPGFSTLVDELSKEFAAHGHAAEKTEMSEWNADWDTLYPFSAFLAPWQFKLPSPLHSTDGEDGEVDRVEIRAVEDDLDEQKGTRSLTVEVRLRGVVWPALAFDADVLEWTLDDRPPTGYTRHHVKSATFLGTDTYRIGLVLNATSPSPLAISHVGIRRRAMWPARKDDVPRDPVTGLFERVDQWLEHRAQGRIDAMLMACVGGVTML